MNIHHIGTGRNFLSESDLRPLASVFAQAPSSKTSAKYQQVKTIDIINLFANQGWLPVVAQEQRVNKIERSGFQKHLIRFRHENFQAMTRGGSVPEILLRNSHDTTTSYQLMAGIFRMACLNGLIVSEASFGMIKIMHMAFEPRAIIDVTRKFADGLPRVMGQVEQYQGIEMTPTDRQIFGEAALMLKMDPDDDVVPMRKENGIFRIDDREFSVPRLLESKRLEDKAPTLWNTYNSVQEKLTKGNRFEIESNGYSSKKVRGIKSIDETVRVNRGLWHLMSEMAKQKGATA